LYATQPTYYPFVDQCDIWARSKAGASHYFRPLKYHGDGPVGQHGPNPDAPIDKDTEPYFKLR